MLLVALLVLVAGCSGGIGGDGTTTTAAQTTVETGTATDGETSTPGNESGNASSTTAFEFNGTWDNQYRTGQYYRYEITADSIDGTATYEWEVLSATDDEVTVRAKLVTSNTTSERTVTASPDKINSKLSGSPTGSVATLGFGSPYYSSIDGKSLSVGDSWEVSGANGDTSFKVERVSTYAGLECANFVVRTNGSVTWESCVSPESPLPGHMAFYEEEGDDEPAFEMVLVEYRSGN
ncbi:hypothetical protein BM92_13590 [Haloferax mediterranei ATCC 33500]|uniref:Uncharacterized protein n=1 Tax=Haloferax mediterranei (strain ATCC 33500 / DSM 1411 / JCM 8866 / NBRC 14739 / NCIMB 2177 / R-4) TaxID=523841 RepID=A0A059TX79_HALMT|nr:hypothetical protein BM92_13590 [Haloferax mediterranei ATCC 33500]